MLAAQDLDAEERAVFDDEARALKDAYDIQMKEYNKRHKPAKKTAKQRKVSQCVVECLPENGLCSCRDYRIG